MTNYEYYKEQIEKITRVGLRLACHKDTNKFGSCDEVTCSNCIFNVRQYSCSTSALKWADAEYIEPGVDWSKVAVDTPILVSNDNVHWHRRHFTKYENREVHAWRDGKTSYTIEVACPWKYAKLAEVDNGI